jgi:glutamine synthetase
MSEHVSSMLLLVQKNDWDGYRKQVTPWEKERYFGVL